MNEISFEDAGNDLLGQIFNQPVTKPVDQIIRNRVYVYRSLKKQFLQGLGDFYIATFSFDSKDVLLIKNNFKRSSINAVFCYVLDENYADNQQLNFNWSKSKKYTFNVLYKIDWQKLQAWYLQQRKQGKVISSFYVKN